MVNLAPKQGLHGVNDAFTLNERAVCVITERVPKSQLGAVTLRVVAIQEVKTIKHRELGDSAERLDFIRAQETPSYKIALISKVRDVCRLQSE